jgi:hypothetical protein
MWKNVIAISVLIASISLLIHSLSTAKASMGPVVSFASNPIHSIGGYSGGSVTENISGQQGSEFIVTDITISAQYNEQLEVVFTTTSGAEVGRYKTWNYSNYNGPAIIDSHLRSGLRVPESEGLTIQVNGRGSYTFSGYFAHP